MANAIHLKGKNMEALLNQLLVEVKGITQESIDANANYFKTKEQFFDRLIWRLEKIRDKVDCPCKKCTTLTKN